MLRCGFVRLVSSLTVCFLVCLLIMTCLSNAQAAASKRGGTLMIAVEGEEANLNPHLVTGASGQPVLNNIFNLLIYMNFKFEIIPGLARSWEVSKDGLTYTFHLAKNATWHDGKPCTSADVDYTLREIYPQSPRGAWWKPGDNVSTETPDPYTFVIKLKETFAPLLATLAFQVTGPSILPKHLYEGTDVKKNPFNSKPIGTGPFMFKEWVKGSHIELVRNPNYFAKGTENKPYLDRVVFRTIPDSSARVLALKKGEIDLLPSTFLPLDDIADLSKDKNIVVDRRGGGPETIKFLLFNLRQPPLSNKLVRQAIAYAIDKEAIRTLALAGEAKLAKSIVTANTVWAFNPKVPQYTYDIKKANALFDKAGYPKGADGTRFKVRIATIAGRGSDPAVIEVIQDSLKKVGVDAQMSTAELSSFYDAVFMRWDFDIVLQQAATGPDPTAGVSRFLHTKQIKKATFVNAMGYSNPEVDRLLDIEFKQTDKKQRTASWHKIQQLVLDDLPLLPIYESIVANAYRANWADLITTLYGTAQSREDAYIKK